MAQKRGKLLRGGQPDIEAAALCILKDWNGGAIEYYTMPPAPPVSSLLETSVVSEFAKEFKIEDM